LTKNEKLTQLFVKAKRGNLKLSLEKDGIEEVQPDLPLVDLSGKVDLFNLINLDQTTCLNEKKGHEWKNVFVSDGISYLESDCDQQLLFTIRFSSLVDLSSIKLETTELVSAPKTIKLFMNRFNMDFDAAMDEPPREEIVVPKSHYLDQSTIKFSPLKWKQVSSLTLFVEDNWENTETTVLSFLQIIGTKS